MRVNLDHVRAAFGARGSALREPDPDPFDRSPPGRHAVVAALLRQSPGGAEVLLIRRAERALDPWSGHMALPGGHGEPQDSSLVATAVREISEEVGLDLLQHAALLGPLPPLVAQPADFTIFPLVFALASGPEPEPNPSEVQEVVWATLSHLRSRAARSVHAVSVDHQRHQLPAFDVGGRIVWGLTYRILEAMLSTLDAVEGGRAP